MYLVEAGHEDEGISRNSDRETPLMAAVRHKDGEDMVRLLAARFPRCISWENKEGLDAFQLAAKLGADKILSILLSLSPSKAELLSHTSSDGNTALHYASAYGNMKAISLLATAGSDPYFKNVGGYTALDYSSTVQAEVYFRGLVVEMEKKKAADSEKAGRRRGGSGPGSGVIVGPGGVRLVDENADMMARARSPSLSKGVMASQPSSGRATPSGWREGWPKALRSRAGSTD